MESFNEYIDTSFDSKFEENEFYTWLPWIGREYSKSKIKTLILGESTYNWAVKSDTREKVKNRINQNNHLRIVHKNNAIDFNGKSPYARNIERAIFLKKKTKRSDAHLLWTNVAYHNLVLRAMPTKKHRPKYEDYLAGWLTFIELTQSLNVEQCIVYGLEKNKLKSFKEAFDSKDIPYTFKKIKAGIGRSYPKSVNIKFKNKEIKVLFIRHPSSFFSWKKWGGILNKELNMESIVASST
ncbi:hypothetical protein L4D76_22365 [Photobacterium sagamiensis]|uniref:hypothetical protein n=1 Tax=Photobacterium sagamiensis TaxID=2910241 RepID=UPI003D1213E2